MKIIDPGAKVSEKDVEAIESEIGVRLPHDYREFIFRHNGGQPTPDIVDVPGAPGTPTDVQVFFGIGRAEKTSNIAWNCKLILERIGTLNLIPIACDSGGSLFCFEVRGGVVGGIVYCDLGSEKVATFDVAGSFGEFVRGIRQFET